MAWWEKSPAEDDLLDTLKQIIVMAIGFASMVWGYIKEGLEDIYKDA